MNKEFEALLAKHLNGTLTEAEKQSLAVWLRVPENQLYLAPKIDEQFFDETLDEIAEDETGLQLYERIQQQIQQDSVMQPEPEDDGYEATVISMPWYRRNLVRWMAGVAAAIILVLSICVMLNSKTSVEQPVAVQKNNEAVEKDPAVLRHEVNTTGKEKTLQLPDGSVVVLADKSEISYMDPFAGKREIILSWKAFFKVAKDTTKPFTVISGELSTTALGTDFTVTAFNNTNRIVVRYTKTKSWSGLPRLISYCAKTFTYNQARNMFIKKKKWQSGPVQIGQHHQHGTGSYPPCRTTKRQSLCSR